MNIAYNTVAFPSVFKLSIHLQHSMNKNIFKKKKQLDTVFHILQTILPVKTKMICYHFTHSQCLLSACENG